MSRAEYCQSAVLVENAAGSGEAGSYGIEQISFYFMPAKYIFYMSFFLIVKLIFDPGSNSFTINSEKDI